MKNRRIVIGALGVFISILSSCQLFDNGSTELIQEYYNPSQSLKVIVFEKFGNATVNNSIQCSIQNYNYELTNEATGNILTLDQFERIHKPKEKLLVVNWIDNKTVEIIYPSNVRLFKMEKQLKTNIGRVTIYYKTTDD